MKSLKCLFVLIIFSSMAHPLYGEVVTASKSQKDAMPPTAFQTYLKNADAKFDKGLVNFTAGLTEVIRQPQDSIREANGKRKWFAGFKGVGLGLVNGICDVTGGFLNTTTAILPQFEIPLPQGGIKPEKVTGGNAEVFPYEDIVGTPESASTSTTTANNL